MKCLKKEQIKRENKVRHVMNERQILQGIRHPFIVKMNWAFQSVKYIANNILIIGTLLIHCFGVLHWR
jgi:serine/threonine protein kinase